MLRRLDMNVRARLARGLAQAPVQIIVPSFLHPVHSDKVVAVARLLPVRLHVNKAGSTSCPVTTDPDMPAAAVRVVPGNPNSMARWGLARLTTLTVRTGGPILT